MFEMIADFFSFLKGIIIDGVREYGKWVVAVVLIWLSRPYLKAFVLRLSDRFTGKHAENTSHHPKTQAVSRKPVTGSSKRECAQSAYKTASSYWHKEKDAYSAFIWLSLAVMLGINDGAAKSFRQTVSSFDDTLRKNLSVPQIKAAVEEAQIMFSSVQIQPRKTLSKHSAKPADIKRTMQERIARKLVNAVKSAKHSAVFRKVLRTSSSKSSRKN